MKLSKTWSLAIAVILCIGCSKSGTEEKIITDDDGVMQTVDTSANKKSVGDAANDILSVSQFESILFEIYYVSGFEPTNTAIANFNDFLENRVDKPGGIQIVLKEISTPGQAVYSIDDIRDMEDDIRTAYNDDKELAVFGIFLDGEYSENSDNGSVLGVAYRNTSFVIFEETIKSFSNQPLAPSTSVLESTVMNHEFGHLLGLVNAGTPMVDPHQDVTHGRHCTTDDCLMFWTAETGEGLINMISGGSIPGLDSLCLADLQANGGK